MLITFREIDNDLKWDDYVRSLPEYSFLNSSARFRFNLEMGSRSSRYGIFDSEKFIGVITTTIYCSKLFGFFMDCKHSPLLKEYRDEYMEEITQFCKKLAKDNNCFMFRFSPLIEESSSLEFFYKKRGFVKAPIHNVDALISQHMDLSKSMDELKSDLSSSRKNRLNKLFRDESVEVRIFDNKEMFDLFEKFHNETVKLKGYVDKPTKQLMKELEIQQESDMCYMVVGYADSVPISIWQCTRFGKNLHLYQACSSTEYREKNMIMTTLLYWKTLELGKELGCTVFDMFGGVVPKGFENSNHPWKGVSDFKESLGGEKVTYMHSRDFAISKIKYLAYYAYSYVRTRMKGYTINW